MKKISVIVVEDQNVVREGMVAMLSVQPDIDVFGEADNGLRAVELAKFFKPDVILLDMVMPKQDGLSSIPKIKEVSPNTNILVVSGFAESDKVFNAIKSGAIGYMLKDTPRDKLLKAIREVAQGQASLDPSIAIRVINDFEKHNTTNRSVPIHAVHLTRREKETLTLIARGFSNQEIANTLVVTERTIAKYVSSVLNKLHLANRTQAALYAIQEGFAAYTIQ